MQHPVPRSTTRPLAALLLLATFSASPWAQPVTPQPLNDTGITWSGNATSGNATTCDASHPAGQDCHYGRDKAAADGTLSPKTGASAPNGGIANGFDYTKVCNSGELAGQGSCPADPALGAGANDWACTKDNVTGLIWEVKVDNASHKRHQGHQYTWYDSSFTPPGEEGSIGSCNSTLTSVGDGNCNTQTYVAAVNTAPGLCGHTDWRMPKVGELAGILDYGRSPPAALIDPDFFPHTATDEGYWTGMPYADYPNSNSWTVLFSNGVIDGYYQGGRDTARHVRLVRGGL